jgi:hypothetical protein
MLYKSKMRLMNYKMGKEALMSILDWYFLSFTDFSKTEYSTKAITVYKGGILTQKFIY